MDAVLKVSVLLLSGVGLRLMFRFLVRWLTYHREAARLNGNSLVWKSEVKQSPEYLAMRQSRLRFFTTFFGTLVMLHGLVTLLHLWRY